MPSIFIKYARDKEKKEIITTATLVTIDAITIFKGVPAFMGAKTIMSKAVIGLEVLNAAGNMALNLSKLSKDEFKGTQFEAIVNFSDMVMLGIGAKNGVRSLPALCKSIKSQAVKLNKEIIVNFLAAYLPLKEELTTLAKQDNLRAQLIEIIYKVLIKHLDATEEGRALIRKAEGAGNWLNKLDNLGLTALKSEINLLDDVAKAKFLDDFAGASDDVLRALNAESDLVSVWKNVKHLKNEAKSVEFLQWLKKANSSHLPIHLKGEVNALNNAVGCHLQSAVDGSRVKILPNPPALYIQWRRIDTSKIRNRWYYKKCAIYILS